MNVLPLRRWHRNYAFSTICYLSKTRAFKLTPFNFPEIKMKISIDLLRLCLTGDFQTHFATCYSAHRAWRKALIFPNIGLVFPLVNYLADKQCSIGFNSSSRVRIDFLPVLFPRYFSWRRWTLHGAVQSNGFIFACYCVSWLLDKAKGNEGTHGWAWNDALNTPLVRAQYKF